MSRAARVYDFTLNANGAFVILAEGSFYRLMSATGAVEVRRNNGSIVGPLLPGQGERAEFISLTITDKSGAANAGTILIADDSFIDERISGEVSVTDSGFLRAVVGASFSAGFSVAASPGNYSHLQLWNPVASGKNLIVRQFVYSCANALIVRQYGVALSTLAAGNMQSKKSTGAASIAETRTEFNAVQLGTDRLMTLPTNNPGLVVPWTDPVVLEPGYGLLMVGGAVNLGFYGNFDYFEVKA